MEEKIKITVPESWADVSLKKFIEINNIQEENPLLRSIEIISILSDVDPEVIKASDKESLDEILKLLAWTGTEPTKEYSTSINLKGEEFHLTKLSALTNGEWIDLDGYCENHIQNIHKIMSILYRKSGEKYDTKVCASRHELFLEEAKVSDVFGTMLFFSLIGSKFMNYLPDYLQTFQTTE